MKRIHTKPGAFESIDLLDAVGRANNVALGAPGGLDKILGLVGAHALEAAQNPSLLHGRRVESMFGYVVASLGKAILVKQEDGGDAFVAVDDEVLMPDYRIVLSENRQMLVEVKNCHIRNPSKKLTFKESYLNALRRYGDLQGLEVKIAVYWSAWRVWTLLSTGALETVGSKVTTRFIDAFRQSEMHELGDVMLGTKPPMVMRVNADPNKPNTIGPDGLTPFTIAGVQMFAGEIEVKRRHEKNLLLYMMLYGGWVDEHEQPTPDITDGRLNAVQVAMYPEEVNEAQGFDFVGSLSSMMSRRYNELTVSGQRITRLAPPVNPGSLGAKIPERVTDMELPLWVFVARPEG